MPAANPNGLVDRERFYDVGVKALLWFSGMGALSATIWRPTGLVNVPISTGVGAVCGMCMGSICSAPIAFLIRRKHWHTASSIVFYPASFITLAVSYWGPWMPWSGAAVGAASALLLSLITRFALEDESIVRAWNCRTCGYDLRGSPEGVCPECGSQQHSTPDSERPA
jgi:hypothetical protein